MAKKRLTTAIAEKFEAGCFVDLTKFTELTDDAAMSLGWYGGYLDLSGVTVLSDAGAESLSRHIGHLDLSGVTVLSNLAAKSLGNHEGGLSLNGLTSLSNAAAEGLSTHNSHLNLTGLTSLSAAAADSLRQHKGLLKLGDSMSLSSLSAVSSSSPPFRLTAIWLLALVFTCSALYMTVPIFKRALLSRTRSDRADVIEGSPRSPLDQDVLEASLAFELFSQAELATDSEEMRRLLKELKPVQWCLPPDEHRIASDFFYQLSMATSAVFVRNVLQDLDNDALAKIESEPAINEITHPAILAIFKDTISTVLPGELNRRRRQKDRQLTEEGKRKYLAYRQRRSDELASEMAAFRRQQRFLQRKDMPRKRIALRDLLADPGQYLGQFVELVDVTIIGQQREWKRLTDSSLYCVGVQDSAITQGLTIGFGPRRTRGRRTVVQVPIEANAFVDPLTFVINLRFAKSFLRLPPVTLFQLDPDPDPDFTRKPQKTQYVFPRDNIYTSLFCYIMQTKDTGQYVSRIYGVWPHRFIYRMRWDPPESVFHEVHHLMDEHFTPIADNPTFTHGRSPRRW